MFLYYLYFIAQYVCVTSTAHCKVTSLSSTSYVSRQRDPARIFVFATVYRYCRAYPFLLFSFSVLHLLVVGSVRQIKLTYAGF